ncbi:uncharacterized protein MYCFIDRAFT_82619 [Pseudocercospora fijiensis CIRAD86]|uniref:DUF7730 domain-containing protein n=1 Tax=Pseudocercospora fijiensis (strain CIRAD86) TaxID=383855 RepID=M3B8I9_PSEFD|nr:uncharacterized protein MYCFIDRAFT_82619 [Pseudocercospora fijiensis CIRAD86]EME85642.1 hypothetical protein MYCFIDRAFT_82619 [Pseudocercospora fijiensis CIRAD86]
MSGYEPWSTSSRLVTGGALAQMSTFSKDSLNFQHLVKIEHEDAFKLTPLTITEGSFAGRHVLMLEPVTDHFRFLDLPPEIRNLIYDELLREHRPVRIATYKAKGRARRAVRSTLHQSHPGLTWNSKFGTWTGQASSAHVILQVNKQMLAEAAPIAYGSNVFQLDDHRGLRDFLEGIGSMRAHLKQIRLLSPIYYSTVAITALHKLKDAKGLASLEFPRNMLSDNVHAYKGITPQGLFNDCKQLLKVLCNHRKKQKDGFNELLEIIKITPGVLSICEKARRGEACDCGSIMKEDGCKNVMADVERWNAKLRNMMAEEFGIGTKQPCPTMKHT